MLFCFLNILIAVISQAFEEYEMNQIIELYTKKVEMNVELDMFLRYFYLRIPEELIILTGSKNDMLETNDEWFGLVNQIKTFSTNETLKVLREISNIKLDIKNLFKKMTESVS